MNNVATIVNSAGTPYNVKFNGSNKTAFNGKKTTDEAANVEANDIAIYRMQK